MKRQIGEGKGKGEGKGRRRMGGRIGGEGVTATKGRATQQCLEVEGRVSPFIPSFLPFPQIASNITLPPSSPPPPSPSLHYVTLLSRITPLVFPFLLAFYHLLPPFPICSISPLLFLLQLPYFILVSSFFLIFPSFLCYILSSFPLFLICSILHLPFLPYLPYFMFFFLFPFSYFRLSFAIPHLCRYFISSLVSFVFFFLSS